MIKLPYNFEMDKYGLHVRFVNEGDAVFILKLRTDPKLTKYIHDTDNDIKKQKLWISQYKIRENEGQEYYFIFYKDNSPIGLNRIYKIHDTTFTTGSWIFDNNASFECSILGSIITREIAFEILNMDFEDGFDGCHVDNKKVIRFNKYIGLKETGRIYDEKGEYLTMSLTKPDFELNKKKLLYLLGY